MYKVSFSILGEEFTIEDITGVSVDDIVHKYDNVTTIQKNDTLVYDSSKEEHCAHCGGTEDLLFFFHDHKAISYLCNNCRSSQVDNEHYKQDDIHFQVFDLL
jgi:hypothetical protein